MLHHFSKGRLHISARSIFFAALLAPFSASVVAAPMSDAEIARTMIGKDLAAYFGPCPCPYNTMRNGRACGSCSAYSRPGGYSPICYDRDVTPAMMREYRSAH